MAADQFHGGSADRRRVALLSVRGALVRPSLPRGIVLLVIGVTYLALQAARNMELFGFFVPVAVAGTIGLRLPPASGPFLGRIGSPLLALMALAWLAIAGWPPSRIRPGASAGHFVAQALRHARATGLTDRRVLNAYGFGGQLIAMGIPTFIDGRSELFGENFILSFLGVLKLEGQSQPVAALDRFNVGWTLRTGTPLIQLLDVLPEWRRDYADEVAIIHVRTTARPAPPSLRLSMIIMGQGQTKPGLPSHDHN